MRWVRVPALVLAGLALLALALDAIVGISQPSLDPGSAEGILRTFDEQGRAHETRLAVFDDGGTPWIQSGHHFRGWYHRLVRNPEVELVQGGVPRPYVAVPLDTPEARDLMRRLIQERVGVAGFYLIRTFLLFAEVKPIRLDPREEHPDSR